MSAITIIRKLSSSLISNQQSIPVLVSILAIFGSVVILSGGIWDAISHFLKEPDFFWTTQHVVVYSGVTMISSAGLLGSILIIKKRVDKNMKKGIIVLLIGSIIQIIAGFGDSISHDVFGIDGLVSWSHQPLEFGILLTALGGFLIIKSIKYGKIKKLIPISIISLIFSISWLGFNLSLLAGGTILCLPFYEIFSSGCAIL
jgi:hypothetical protein